MLLLLLHYCICLAFIILIDSVARAFGAGSRFEALKPATQSGLCILINWRITLQMIFTRKIFLQNSSRLNSDMAQYGHWDDQNDQKGAYLSRIHPRKIEVSGGGDFKVFVEIEVCVRGVFIGEMSLHECSWTEEIVEVSWWVSWLVTCWRRIFELVLLMQLLAAKIIISVGN